MWLKANDTGESMRRLDEQEKNNYAEKENLIQIKKEE